MVIKKFQLFEADEYSDYIVGFPSGEAIFVDENDIATLEDRKLIFFDTDCGKYIFFDDDLSRVKGLIIDKPEASDIIFDFLIRRCGLNRYDFEVRENNIIDVVGNVNIDSLGIKYIPYEFGVINGDFSCSYNNLISLHNSPTYIDGTFKCNNNALHSLSGGPAVAESYYCGNNFLINLDGIMLGNGARKVDARYNKISRINFKNMLNIKSLILSFNEMKDLDGISKLKNLEILTCDNNKIRNLDEILSIKTLRELYCSNNNLDGLRVGGLEKLEFLSCKGNKLKKIEGLESLKKLNTLSCGDNNFDTDYLEYLKLYCLDKNIKLYLW